MKKKATQFRNRAAGKVLLLTLSMGFSALFAKETQSKTNPFPPGQSCVAYRTVKGILFWGKEEVTGTNCDITARLVKDGRGETIHMKIPIASFRSGNGSRDRHVAKILHGETHPDLFFTSDPLSGGLNGITDRSTVSGKLSIGGIPYAITMNLHVTGEGNRKIYSGSLQTTFSAFRIEPPKVGPGGVVADTPDRLELLFRIFEENLIKEG